MNILSVVGLIIAIASSILGVYSFVNTKQKIHFIWGLFSMSVALWGFGIFKFASAVELGNSVFWWRIGEIGVIFIPVFLTHFVYEFLNRTKKKLIFLLYFISFIFLFFDIFTNHFFGPVRFIFNQFYYITPTPIYTTMVVLFLFLAIYNILILYKELKKEKDSIRHQQIQYLIIAFLVGFAGGATSFLPVYGISVYPVYNLAISISALVVVYSMFKYQLLNIKILATQLLIFSIWFFLFGRILLSGDILDRIADIILLLIMIVFGLLLVRSVLKVEELSKAKSEFVTIASHQLRTPITAIKGYTSLLLEGSFGPVPEKEKMPLNIILQSSNRLVLLIDNFLNISRIERAKMEYDFQKVDFKKIVKSVFEEFEVINAKKKKKLDLELKISEKDDFGITADPDKIRQIIYNLIDNAMKYTSKGFVKVALAKNKEKGTVELSISDSGIGMSKEALEKIFEKFSRAQNGSSLYTEGTGLGLYVAKEMAKVHEGDVWAESEGEGKGSTFYLELPVKFITPKEKKEEEKKKKENVEGFVKGI